MNKERGTFFSQDNGPKQTQTKRLAIGVLIDVGGGQGNLQC